MNERPADQRGSGPVCRWRTSAETLDVIEALERIEALLLRLDERMRAVEAREAEQSVALAEAVGQGGTP
jgi:hypothetical protein